MVQVIVFVILVALFRVVLDFGWIGSIIGAAIGAWLFGMIVAGLILGASSREH